MSKRRGRIARKKVEFYLPEHGAGSLHSWFLKALCSNDEVWSPSRNIEVPYLIFHGIAPDRGDLLFLDEEYARRMISYRRARRLARTWGDFLHRLEQADEAFARDVLQCVARYGSWWWFVGRGYDYPRERTWRQYKALKPVKERPPFDHESFRIGEWEWAQKRARSSLMDPRTAQTTIMQPMVIKRWGHTVREQHRKTKTVFRAEDRDAILIALRQLGQKPWESQAVIDAACGKEDNAEAVLKDFRHAFMCKKYKALAGQAVMFKDEEI